MYSTPRPQESQPQRGGMTPFARNIVWNCRSFPCRSYGAYSLVGCCFFSINMALLWSYNSRGSDRPLSARGICSHPILAASMLVWLGRRG
jgi:hypothetical protein